MMMYGYIYNGGNWSQKEDIFENIYKLGMLDIYK